MYLTIRSPPVLIATIFFFLQQCVWSERTETREMNSAAVDVQSDQFQIQSSWKKFFELPELQQRDSKQGPINEESSSGAGYLADGKFHDIKAEILLLPEEDTDIFDSPKFEGNHRIEDPHRRHKNFFQNGQIAEHIIPRFTSSALNESGPSNGTNILHFDEWAKRISEPPTRSDESPTNHTAPSMYLLGMQPLPSPLSKRRQETSQPLVGFVTEEMKLNYHKNSTLDSGTASRTSIAQPRHTPNAVTHRKRAHSYRVLAATPLDTWQSAHSVRHHRSHPKVHGGYTSSLHEQRSKAVNIINSYLLRTNKTVPPYAAFIAKPSRNSTTRLTSRAHGSNSPGEWNSTHVANSTLSSLLTHFTNSSKVGYAHTEDQEESASGEGSESETHSSADSTNCPLIKSTDANCSDAVNSSGNLNISDNDFQKLAGTSFANDKSGKSTTTVLSEEQLRAMTDPDAELSLKRKNESEYSRTLRDSLRAVQFQNGETGKVAAGQEFAYLSQCGLYTEPQNVSVIQRSWVTKTFTPYFYLYEKPKHYEKCKPSAWMNGTDMRGSVFLSFEVKSLHGSTMGNNAKICEKYCCKEPRCVAWVLRFQKESTANCPSNSFCCWLKTSAPKPEPHEACVAGVVKRDHYKHPPNGMRSAVPLGGLGTGSFELRADGTFHEWTIENQSPGGSAKLGKTSLDMMLLGVRVKKGNSTPDSAVLRTHAPRGFDGVHRMAYSGSYPVSKLAVELTKNSSKDVKLDLYAYSTFHPRKPKHSSTPGVAFSLDIKNPSSSELDVSFMLTLPFGFNDDTIRRGNNFAEVAFTRLVTASDCQRACANKPRCMSWTTNGPFSCMLKDGMPLHSYEYGIISGLKGEWKIREGLLSCVRPGFYPQSGDISLYPVHTGSETTSFAVTDNLETLWKNFKTKGNLNNGTTVNVTGLNGAVSISTKIKPKESKLLTIIFAWYFPNRDISEERVGNFYTNIFKSSVEVAKHLKVDLHESVDNIRQWQNAMIPPKSIFASNRVKSKVKACASSVGGVKSVPECIQDILLNSLSFWRSGMWMENGRWRQWEAYDCANMDAVHIDFHRVLPYVIFYPDLAKQVMLAWADHQLANGMIQESLSQGCLEETSKEGSAGGRSMTDVNVGFIVQAYLLYAWTNDTSFFDEIYPFAVRANDWLINEATKGTGLPYRKPDTYDLFELEKYDHCAYNSFLYLLALRTTIKMAELKYDEETLSNSRAALDRAEKQLDVEMWDERQQFYHAWFDVEWGSPSWLMSDTLYGQVWAYALNLGDLAPRRKIEAHLRREKQRNDTPYGLKAISRSEEHSGSIEDTSLILGDELNSCRSLENITKYESVWMSSSSDWTTLEVYLGMAPGLALHQASKSLDNYRSRLRDQWNFHGLTSSSNYGLDGLPWATSHYTFHLVAWHIPLALSGQQYYAPNGTLRFEPKFDPPYWLPFFTPFAMGNIEGTEVISDTSSEIMYRLTVTSGTLEVQHLSISGARFSDGPVKLQAGEVANWSQPKKTKEDAIKSVLDMLKHR